MALGPVTQAEPEQAESVPFAGGTNILHTDLVGNPMAGELHKNSLLAGIDYMKNGVVCQTKKST
jgi:hypothetical protein